MFWDSLRKRTFRVVAEGQPHFLFTTLYVLSFNNVFLKGVCSIFSFIFFVSSVLMTDTVTELSVCVIQIVKKSVKLILLFLLFTFVLFWLLTASDFVQIWKWDECALKASLTWRIIFFCTEHSLTQTVWVTVDLSQRAQQCFVQLSFLMHSLVKCSETAQKPHFLTLEQCLTV